MIRSLKTFVQTGTAVAVLIFFFTQSAALSLAQSLNGEPVANATEDANSKTAVTLGTAVSTETAGEAPHSDSVSSVTVARSEPRIVKLPMRDGWVSSRALFDVLSKDVHWAAGTVTAFANLVDSGAGAQVADLSPEQLEQIVARFPAAFTYEIDPAGEPTYLIVDVDEFSKSMSSKKTNLRKMIANRQGRELASLKKVDETWGSRFDGVISPARILVVLSGFHGVDAPSHDVAIELHDRTNLPACTFQYPNDGPVAESAVLLISHLERLHQQYPDSRITLVTHSMGGLVARAALELSQLSGLSYTSVSVSQRTGVDQLIQVCPPNHGSALAEYGPLLEGAEQAYRFISRRGGRKDRVLFQAIVDGFNEAAEDLSPDSKLIAEINAAQRNPEVRYSILAGNDAPLRGTMGNLVGSIWQRVSESIAEPEFIGSRIDTILNCDELRKGKGDGVVTLVSARLTGVDDFQELPMHHLVWNEPTSTAGKQMLDAVARRLGISL